VFHLALISFAILRFIPLSTFRLWFPWRGCWHFIVGLNLTPSSAQCFGHIVKSRPSEASNKPTRARISSFSDATLVYDTLTSLRYSFMLSTHELRGTSCCHPGQREEISHLFPQRLVNEHDNWAIANLTLWLRSWPSGLSSKEEAEGGRVNSMAFASSMLAPLRNPQAEGGRC